MQKRQFKDSGIIELKNISAIATTLSYVFTLDERYKPYNILSLTNLNSDNDIEVWINQTHRVIIPAGNQRTFKNYIIRDVRIKNIGTGTIAINDIRGAIRNNGYIGKQIISSGTSILNIGMSAVRTIISLRK